LVTFIVEVLSKINPRIDNARTCDIEDIARKAKLFGTFNISIYSLENLRSQTLSEVYDTVHQ